MTESLKKCSKEGLASLTHCSSLVEGAVTLLEDYVDSLEAIAHVMNAGVKLTKAISVWGTEFKTYSNQVNIEEEDPDDAESLDAPVDIKALRANLNKSNKKLLSQIQEYSMKLSDLQRHPSAKQRWGLSDKPHDISWESASNLHGEHISSCYLQKDPSCTTTSNHIKI